MLSVSYIFFALISPPHSLAYLMCVHVIITHLLLYYDLIIGHG